MFATCLYQSPFNNNSTTDVTINQLAKISGESRFYIRDRFLPFLKAINNEVIKFKKNYFTSDSSGTLQKRCIY